MDDYRQACAIAMHLWETNYREAVPVFHLKRSVEGVLSQISMMVEGLSKPVKPIPIPERRDEVYRIILRRGCPPHIATRMADEIFAALLGDKKMESAETSESRSRRSPASSRCLSRIFSRPDARR
jgi:hypothetical protein